MNKLIFLGTGAAGFVGSSRQLSSTYFDGMLFDCGGSVVGRLEDAHVVDELSTILISHLHSDHYGGLFDLLVHIGIKCILKEKLTGKKEKRRLWIYSPPGLKEIIRSITQIGKIYDVFSSYVEVNFVEVHDGLELEVGENKVKAILMDHEKTVDFGYLVKNEKFSLFYTGDTREPSALEKLKVDYLIHEATFTETYHESAKAAGHSTGKDAAEIALKVGAKKLFITHVSNALQNECEIEKEARAVFKNTILPKDLDGFELS